MSITAAMVSELRKKTGAGMMDCKEALTETGGNMDEAVEIPLNYGGTRDAYRMYHFDCQFSGSDYTDNPDWLAEKEFLEKHGAEMVFFPYTEGTSSTKIKSLIEQKLV